MRGLYDRLIDVLEVLIPHSLIALLARIGIAVTFFRSGLTKVQGFDVHGLPSPSISFDAATFGLADKTVFLFERIYKVPVIPAELAAYLATASELVLPIFILFGLLTRLAALPLLAMTLVIEIFVFPNAYDTHALWAVALLYLLRYGPGAISLDQIFGGRRDLSI